MQVESTNARKRWDDVAGVQEWESFGNIEMGPHTSFQYRNDPRHLCFVLSRYKFCAKLLAGRSSVAEVGCGDAFGTALVAQSVEKLLAIDWDARLIESNTQRLDFLTNCTFRRQDVVAEALEGTFDAVYSLDVIEHIDQSLEDAFLRHTCQGLTSDGIYIMGTPNVTSEAYASESSRLGHINLKDATGLKAMLAKYFNTVFLFSMNDEVVHTGFYPMAHYLFGVAVGRKKEA